MARWIAACSVLLVTLAGFATVAHAQSATVGVGVGDTSLDLSGLASPGAFVTIQNDGSTIGTVVAGNDGAFQQSFPAQRPGINSLSLSALDSNGRTTGTVYLEVNLQQHFPTAVQVFLPPSIDVPSGSRLVGQPFQIAGSTIPNADVLVYIDNRTVTTVASGADGQWAATIQTTGLAAGAHELFVRSIDGGGAQSYPTESKIFTLARPAASPAPGAPANPTAPIPPRGIFKPAIPAPSIDYPAQGQTVAASPVTISGRGQPKVLVELWDGGSSIGSVFSDQYGAWSLPYDFLNGEHSIRARACVDKQCGNFSGSTAFLVNARKPATKVLRASLGAYSYATKPDGTVALTVNIDESSPPFTVAVDWGDGARSAYTIKERRLTLTHEYEQPGIYNGSVIVSTQDASKQFRFGVSVGSSSDWSKVLLFATLLPIGIIINFRFLYSAKKRSAP